MYTGTPKERGVMNTVSIESTLLVHSQASNEEMLGLWAPQSELRCEKEGILEQVVNFEQALALLLEYPTDLTCQERVRWRAKRMAALLYTCGFPFAARLVAGIEQMLINGLFFEDSWRLQLAEFADAVYETVRRGLLLTTIPQERALSLRSLQSR